MPVSGHRLRLQAMPWIMRSLPQPRPRYSLAITTLQLIPQRNDPRGHDTHPGYQAAVQKSFQMPALGVLSIGVEVGTALFHNEDAGSNPSMACHSRAV